MPSSPLQTVDSDQLLTFCKASAESLRLDVLRVLSVESFGVMELCHIFDTAQSGMSHHLKILSRAGLLQTRREGNSIFYRRAIIGSDNPISHLMTALFESIDRIVLPRDVQKRCAQIHETRARHSNDFFRKNADRLKENQDLIADFSHYGGCLTDLLKNEKFSPDDTVLEVGPGESDLLDQLSQTFHRVLAVDNSKEMLSRACDLAKLKKLGNVEFLHGELADFESDQRTNLIVLNMVLHHLASPVQIFHSARNMLLPGGCLLIADLCSHDQEWTRDICGDLWLGFDSNDLDKWAESAGLEKGQSVYLGLKNGFQVQVRLYHQAIDDN